MLTRNVADGIHLIEHAYTNAYLVEGDGEVLIVDTGLPAARSMRSPRLSGRSATGRAPSARSC